MLKLIEIKQEMKMIEYLSPLRNSNVDPNDFSFRINHAKFDKIDKDNVKDLNMRIAMSISKSHITKLNSEKGKDLRRWIIDD